MAQPPNLPAAAADVLRGHLREAYALECGLVDGDPPGHLAKMAKASYPTALVQQLRDECAGIEARCVVARIQRAWLDQVIAARS